MLAVREDAAVVGGKLIGKGNKITGGIYTAEGLPIYQGLHKEYSGYMHRASLQQEAEVIDIRCMKASRQAETILEDLIGHPYLQHPVTGKFDWQDCLKECGCRNDRDFVDLSRLGAVVTKGVANVPWPGNPTPRVAETYGGMLNAIGLQNPGIDVFVERDIPFLQKYDTKIIVNVCGKTVEDYLAVVERLEDQPVDMLEINVSCPNVKEGAIAFGQKPDSLYDITSQVKKKAKQPVIMKLSPNVTDITEMARAAEAAGADALSMINTITGMKIDIHKRKFALANKTGGLSGPAIKPVAVRMVYQAARAVKIPIIGMGGIANAEDAIEFLLAGASAVAVGAMNFVNPYTTVEVAEGIEAYMERYGIGDVAELIGAVES